MKSKFRFKPSKQIHENTNRSRMLSASQCLTSCNKYRSKDEDSVRDLIADLLHYADAKKFNTAEILKDATDNWTAER